MFAQGRGATCAAIEMLGVTRFDLVIDLLPLFGWIFLFEERIWDDGDEEAAKRCRKSARGYMSRYDKEACVGARPVRSILRLHGRPAYISGVASFCSQVEIRSPGVACPRAQDVTDGTQKFCHPWVLRVSTMSCPPFAASSKGHPVYELQNKSIMVIVANRAVA